ncbi:hypothetical protein [Arthrobacter sp. zg-Y1110]|uniref:hypothetical protein n=1 Tax=Arthrobacter sp. zg-Y1110 TaxID=2886932 RepID=UPI001D136475|nr:hypothetical protein [Arthrobacter sp. zg-Y1110]MCC3292552.1 hypothetical protein [Arthrobacter sp. zg-Y1110]UWX87016.1 hypothetical protein N2K99_16835 [Arthrobacter sp. zg-Y1110]
MKVSPAEALKGERGNFMMQALAGSIVSLLSIGAIAGGIAGISQFQVKQQLRAEVTNQASLTDSTFRGDVLWAAGIKAADEHHVEFTVPGPSGGCEISSWAIEPEGDRTRVRVTTVSYPETDTSTGQAKCAGEPSHASAADLIDDAAPESSFTYSNAAGRALSFNDGTPEADADTEKPANVDAGAWKSVSPAAVALDTAVKSSSKMKTPFRFAQTADNLHSSEATPDAPVHFVPDGDLR